MIAQEVLTFMTWLTLALKLLAVLVGAAFALIVTLPQLKKAIKDRQNAKTEEEKAKADLEIQNQLMLLVSNAEQNYATLDKALKSIGDSAGQFKKDYVLSELRDFCDDNHYEYKKQELSEKIDDVVRLTKDVNSK